MRLSIIIYLLPFVAFSLEVVRGPYSQIVTDESALIVFKSDAPASFSVYYGVAPSSMDNSVAAVVDAKNFWDAWEDNVYLARLSGLQPSSRYYYKVVSGSYEYTGIDSMVFTTAPVKGDGNTHFRLFAESDLIYGPSVPWGGSEDSICVAEMHAIHNPVPEIWICQGDVEQEHGCMSQYTDGSWWDPFRSMIQKTTIYTTVGNHDGDCGTWTNREAQSGMYYFAAWYLPRNDYDSSEWYYSFDYGNTRIISLHGLPTDTNNVQHRWLIKELSDTTPMWKILFDHYPVHSNLGTEDHWGLSTKGEKMYDTICDRYGVDAVISGHYHDNFRSPFMTVDSVWRIEQTPLGSFFIKTRHGNHTFFINAAGFHWHKKFQIEINGNVMTGTNLIRSTGNNYIVFDKWTITKTINANDPPVAHIKLPVEQSHGVVGSPVALKGTGADHEDGVLGPAKLAWSYKVDRFDGASLAGTTQISGISDSGGFIPDIEGYYTFYLTATDNNGNTNVDKRLVYVTYPLDTIAKINFGNYTQWGYSHDVTQPAGWINVTNTGWTGNFTAPDNSSWPALYSRAEDFLAMRCIKTTSNAAWNYPIINGSYYVSLRANNSCALNTDSSNVIKNIRVEGISVLHDTVFYFPDRYYPAGSMRLRETGGLVTPGLPVSARYIPIEIADGNLTVELDTAVISDLIIFKPDSSLVAAGKTGGLSGRIVLDIFPNPFNPTVQVTLRNAKCRMPDARLAVFSISGRIVKDFSSEIRSSWSGATVIWDARDQPTGVYFVRFSQGNTILINKTVLVR